MLLAAGDTFRAAAAEQLGTWAERSDAEFVRGAEGGDPSSVIFDGVERAASKQLDLVLADTAGRLHTKTNLMEELKKVRRVAEKGAGTVTETLLVIDATTGQNGLAQAREFREATDVTGVVLTKLDGSAKGGIVFAIETEMGIPVKLVGLGEQVGDLIPFDPDEFVVGAVRPRLNPPNLGNRTRRRERPMGMTRRTTSRAALAAAGDPGASCVRTPTMSSAVRPTTHRDIGRRRDPSGADTDRGRERWLDRRRHRNLRGVGSGSGGGEIATSDMRIAPWNRRVRGRRRPCRSCPPTTSATCSTPSEPTVSVEQVARLAGVFGVER